MEYTIRLADGRELTGLGTNGNNYVSKEMVDEAIFENNLTTMTVSDGETETTYKNMEFVQQMKLGDGYYLCFRQLTEAEITATELQQALAEVYEMILGGS